MSRTTIDIYKVDNVSLLVPDNTVGESFEDIDSPETGRDENGYMHRTVVRYKVGKWSFQYTKLSQSDYEALESIFGDKATFDFTRPSRTNPSTTVTTECYRSKYSHEFYDYKNKVWRNYKFNLIEC